MKDKIVQLRSTLVGVLHDTPWNEFKTADTMYPTIEAKALIINAVEKLNKVVLAIDAALLKSTTEGEVVDVPTE